MRRGTPRVYTEQEKAEFFRLLAERGNVTAVARELGFTRITCYKWAHQAGIFTSEKRRVLPRRCFVHRPGEPWDRLVLASGWGSPVIVMSASMTSPRRWVRTAVSS